MTNHTLTFNPVDRQNFKWISEGIKQYESRAGSDEYATFATGDVIVFNCDADTITKRIVDVQHFHSLDDLLATMPIQDIMPDNPSQDDAKIRWLNYPGYTERIQKYGIYVWKLADL